MCRQYAKRKAQQTVKSSLENGADQPYYLELEW
jgi:hypothetical protein